VSTRRRVVIVGAGFGGLAAAKAMHHLDADVTLVERNNYHLFQPLLYQVASGMLDPSEIAHPVRSILRRLRNVRVRMAEVKGVDLDSHTVQTSEGALGYDVLVIATGSLTDVFTHHIHEHTRGLKHLDEALNLRAHLLRCFERAAECDSAAARRRLLTVAVVGAGPTGVEYSGAAAELINHVLPRDFHDLDFSESSVHLIEAAPAPLGGFAPRLGRAAVRSLHRKGVFTHFGAAVQGVDDTGVHLADGTRVDAATVVWTAGVRAVSPLPTEVVHPDRKGRVQVTPSLHLPGHPEVFVIGDVALFTTRDGPLPMLAPVAIQQGQHVAAVLAARSGGEPDPPFRYRDKGTMATVGRGSAVAQLGFIRLSGLPAWFAWLFVHLIYLVGFRSRIIAVATWAWDFFFYDRPVRLIVDRRTEMRDE